MVLVFYQGGGQPFWNEDKLTFHSMKMMSDRSSKPPMTLPIRIQSEMGMARPFRTSSTVWAGRKTGQCQSKSRSSPSYLLTSLQTVSFPRVMRFVSWAARR